ncbi:MAG: hypothetical protein K2O06_02715 [Acetatifactor sp.]|nr:hypothetical protein [Acetatifactor sp.]
MKHLLKGAAVVAIVLIVSLAIHLFCNMHGIELDSTVTGTMSAICALLLYQGLIRIEKNKDDQGGKR